MQAGPLSYAVPPSLPSDLSRVRDFWEDLRRGEANMPFSDDLDLASLQDLTEGLVLVTVFEGPLRFRFEWAGPLVTERLGSAVSGLFSDEVDLRPPLDGFTAQATETVTRSAPTFFQGPDQGTSRILLPTWGDGHVAMLLGAVSDGSSKA